MCRHNALSDSGLDLSKRRPGPEEGFDPKPQQRHTDRNASGPGIDIHGGNRFYPNNFE